MKCQAKNTTGLVIPIGIINAETVIICGVRIQTYLSFDPDKVVHCPFVTIEKDRIQLIDMNITRETKNSLHIELSSESIPLPKLSTRSFKTSTNKTSKIHYLSFSPGLTCRYSSISIMSTCFYYLSSINFTQLEYHYDRILNNNLASSMRSRSYFTIIYCIITLLILGICVLALYLLCTNRLSSEHMIHLDYIVDPQLAKEAALKLGPEPV